MPEPVVQPRGEESEKLQILYECLSKQRAGRPIDFDIENDADEVIARMLVLQSYETITALDTNHVGFYVKALIKRLTGVEYDFNFLKSKGLLTRDVGYFFPSTLRTYDTKLKKTDTETLKQVFDRGIPLNPKLSGFMHWAARYDDNKVKNYFVRGFLKHIDARILRVCPGDDTKARLDAIHKKYHPEPESKSGKFHSLTGGPSPSGPQKYIR